MTLDPVQPNPLQSDTTIAVEGNGASVDWCAVIAAVVISAASLSVLTAFGVAIGFASVSPWTSNPSATTLVVGAAAWFALSAIYAGAVGGYIVGRIRRPSFEATPEGLNTEDGIHGLAAWGLGLLLSGFLAASVFTSAAGKVADVTAQAAGPTIAETVKGAGSKASDFLSYYVDRALRPGSAAPPAGNSSEDVRPELTRLLTRALSGNLSDDDRAYVAHVIAQRTGLSDADAKTRADQMINDAKAAYQKAIDQAKAAANAARKATIESTTWFAIVTLLAAMMSWYAAVIGGRHREQVAIV
jgi:hypothetical protein